MRYLIAITTILILTLISGLAWAQDALNPDQLLEWFQSGDGRLIIAGILFIVIYLLKTHIPGIEKWLSADCKKVPWLTSKRKKFFANFVLALGPVAIMLSNPSISTSKIIEVAIEIAIGSMGIHSGLKALWGKPKVVAPKEDVPDSGKNDKEEEAEEKADDG